MFEEIRQVTDIARGEWCLGKADAPVTILEYGDFECPYCAAARPMLEALVETEPDAVKLVYRHFPIATIHPCATLAAEAAEAAGLQEQFWKMHKLLFVHQDALASENLHGYAELMGLNMARFDLEMRNRSHLPEVKADFQRGIKDGVNGTPTIFINGVRFDGPRTIPALQTAIVLQLQTQRQETR